MEDERKVKSESDEAKSCVCVCSRTRDTVQRDGLLNDRSREGMEGGGVGKTESLQRVRD